MGRRVDNVSTGEAMDSAIVAWRRDPADRRAMAAVRAGLLVRYAKAIQSGAQGIDELGRAAANLLDRLREGSVEPNEAVVDAVAGAASRIKDPSREAGHGVDDQVERLDAYASGLTDLEFDNTRATGDSPRDEPPLLTTRHDGVRVKPGSFGTASGDRETQASPLPVLLDAWEAVGDHIRGQVESLRAATDGTGEPELRRLVMDLQGAVDNIERLNRALAEYARKAAPMQERQDRTVP